MALTCKVGPSLTFDIVAYARSKIEDLVAPQKVPDSAFSLYVEAAIEEFARWSPLGDNIVGNIGANPPSSPLITVNTVSRYVCNAPNGFTLPVKDVTDVLFRASGVFSAASEIAYLALMPISPLNWFRIDKDLLNSPSSRHIRDQYLQELDHYGIGYWRRVRDSASGLPAIDIYPPPTTSGIPIFVSYTSGYINSPDGGGNPQYPQVPDDQKVYLAWLLLAEVMEEESDRIAKQSQTKSGIIQRWSSPADLRDEAAKYREKAQFALGAAKGMVTVSW